MERGNTVLRLDENILNGPSSGALPQLGGGSGIGNKPVRQTRIRLCRMGSREPKRVNDVNVKTFRRLSIFQALTAGAILFWEVFSNAIAIRNYNKPVEVSGIGLWGPLLFFSVASLLTWIMTTRPQSRCLIGTALAFQIISVIVGSIMIFLAAVSMAYMERWHFVNGREQSYEVDVSARVFCTLMLLATIPATMIALGTSIMLCRVQCCARTNVYTIDDEVMYEVEDLQR